MVFCSATLEELQVEARALLVSLGCPAHVLRAPQRGPERDRVVRWLYFKFKNVPDNGESVTVVEMEALKSWVQLMGVPSLVVDREAVATLTVEQQRLDDARLFLRLVKTVHAHAQVGFAERDVALMELVANNTDSVFSAECDLFPSDLEPILKSRDLLINDRGEFLAHDMDTLELKVHDLNLDIERARQQIEEKNAQGLQRQHSSADLDIVQSIVTYNLKNACEELVERADRFHQFYQTVIAEQGFGHEKRRKRTHARRDFTEIGKRCAGLNKNLDKLTHLVHTLTEAREIVSTL
jgi:hypothetical protein